MAKIVEYLDPINLVYTTDYSEMKVGYDFRVNSEPELVQINPIVFDEEPSVADLNALDEEQRITVRGTGAYILCIESDYYGRSSADVGVNLWPCYVSENTKLTLRYSKNTSSVMTVTGERYPYLCAYKVASDEKGLRLARCGDLAARPDAGFGKKYYNSETMSPGEYVEFAEESSDDEEITETTVIKAGRYKFADELETTAFFEIALPITVGDVDYAYLVNDVSADDSSMLKLYYLNSADDCVLAYSSEAGEDITQGWQTEDLKIFTVRFDTEVKLTDGVWFDASTEVYTEDGEEDDEDTSSMMLIKAGTYRWNDVLTYTADFEDISIKAILPDVTIPDIGTVNIALNSLSFIRDGSGDIQLFYNVTGAEETANTLIYTDYNQLYWNVLYTITEGVYPEGYGQIFTVTEDTYVPTAFGLFAVANWQPYEESKAPTAESVTAKILSLIDKSNATTGKGDTDLTKAVMSLVKGFGGGSVTVPCRIPHVYHTESEDDLPTDAFDGSMAVVTAMVRGWVEKTWKGMSTFYGNNVWTDGKNIYYSNGDEHYILNGDTWEQKTWNGLTYFYGEKVWTDGKNIYYSNGDEHYILNGDTWVEKTWEGLSDFAGEYVFTIGTKVYCRDKGTYNGSEFIYRIYGLNGDTWEQTNAISKTETVWSDGKNIYCTDTGTYNPSEGVVSFGVYKLNGDTFDKVSSAPFNVSPYQFWTDGEILYYQYENYVQGAMKYAMYTFEDGTFTEVEKMNVFAFIGQEVWTDGKDIYLSKGDSQYFLGEVQENILYSRQNGKWVSENEVDFGKCYEPHIIEVEELPETGVEGATYKAKETVLADLIYTTNSTSSSYSLLLFYELLLGTRPTIFNVQSLDEVTEPMQFPVGIYFVIPEEMVYQYDEDDEGTGTWTALPSGKGDDEGVITYKLSTDIVYCENITVAFSDVIVVNEGTQYSFLFELQGFGVNYSFNTIPTKTTEDIQVSDLSSSYHIYYIEDENDVFLYGDPEGTGTNSWFSFSIMDVGIFNGCISDASEATAEGYYALGDGSYVWKKYFIPKGQINIFSNSTVDVKDYATVKVELPEYGGGVNYL